MANDYIRRSLEPVLKKAVGEFPAVVLTGPRQSGKTTLLKQLFSKGYGYVSLELPDIRAAAIEDPRSFLEMHQPPVIFDEAQYAPVLFPYVKEIIDDNRRRHGQYVFSGSQNLLLMEKITESLAGRAAILRLLPLSRRESGGRPHAAFPWESKSRGSQLKKQSSRQLWRSLLRGSYPEPAANPRRDINLWYASYVQTYLERDVRTMRQVGDLTQFQGFLRALAARSGQLLNLTGLAGDLGLAVNTAKAWLSVLEATHQVIILRPYFVNIGKRFVKTPKIYFMDTGMLCYLTGLRDPEHARNGPMGGAIFETAVLTEIVKTLTHRGIEPQVHFWRTSSGAEVDIVVDFEGRLIPIEVKLSATPRPEMASSIKTLMKDMHGKAEFGYVVHPGDVRLPLGGNVTALPFGEL